MFITIRTFGAKDANCNSKGSAQFGEVVGAVRGNRVLA